MNAPVTFPAIKPFNPMAAYNAEAEAHRQTYARLLRANTLLRMACVNGGKVQDVEAVRAFLAECAR
jgi:hypothetical protein